MLPGATFSATSARAVKPPKRLPMPMASMPMAVMPAPR